jgi:hypothetical protein
VVSEPSSRGLRPRSAASASLTCPSRAFRASTHVLPNTSAQIASSSGNTASDTTSATSNGEVRTMLVNGIGSPRTGCPPPGPPPPDVPPAPPPLPRAAPGGAGDGDAEPPTGGTEGVGERVTGRVGEGIGSDGDGSGGFAEGRIEGTLGEGRGNFGVATGRLGKAVGDGSGRPVAMERDAELALKAGAARRAHAAAAPKPASATRAGNEWMALALACCNAIRFIVFSRGAPTVSNGACQVNRLTEESFQSCKRVSTR